MMDPLADPPPAESAAAEASRGGGVAMTRWTMVLMAAQTDMGGAAAAMEQLCRIYWYPIYAFIRRRRGYRHHDAEDLTQGFFAHLLEHATLKRAARDKGRFRNFLLAVLSNFLANERDAATALKRGGGLEILSLDEQTAETLYAREPAGQAPDDRVYDQRWAQALVRQVLGRLGNECAEEGKAQLFAALEPCLTQPDTAGIYAGCARDLGMNEPAVRVAAHRLRRRFGELLRREIAQTVASPDEIDDELRHLLAASVS